MTASKLLTLAALFGATLAAGPALAQPRARSEDQCFLTRDINGFRARDDRTVYIRGLRNQIYRLDLMSNCPGLTFRDNIGFENQGASAWICSPMDATIVFRDTGVPERCPVTAIHHLTADERAALPKRDRP